jgi:methylenetetrahydrofolate reductase (NADPH)
MADNVNLTNIGKASYPELAIPTGLRENHVRVAAELVADGSLELGQATDSDLDQAADILPFGMPVFVPILPLHSMHESIASIAALKDRGFTPVPHIAARRVPSLKVLSEFLKIVTAESGVSRVLLIGGDNPEVAGPFRDSLSLLQSGLLGQAGINEVGFAGYPEGHPLIATSDIREALSLKIALATEQGLGIHLVTQFSFMPERIIEYCSELAGRHPELPVYVGMAGPATLRKLVHFARYCGVSASLSAVRKVGVKVAQLVDHRRPDEQLGRLATYVATHGTSNVVGVHLFSFGGFGATTRWIHDKMVAVG